VLRFKLEPETIRQKVTMRNLILVISLGFNLLILAALAWFGYQGYTAYKSALSSPGSTSSGTITDVIDINDGGHKALFYVIDYSGMKIVASEYSTGTAKKVGDSVKVQVMKTNFSGIKTVNYSIVP
jgi:hypothetical protein